MCPLFHLSSLCVFGARLRVITCDLSLPESCVGVDYKESRSDNWLAVRRETNKNNIKHEGLPSEACNNQPPTHSLCKLCNKCRTSDCPSFKWAADCDTYSIHSCERFFPILPKKHSFWIRSLAVQDISATSTGPEHRPTLMSALLFHPRFWGNGEERELISLFRSWHSDIRKWLQLNWRTCPWQRSRVSEGVNHHSNSKKSRCKTMDEASQWPWRLQATGIPMDHPHLQISHRQQS